MTSVSDQIMWESSLEQGQQHAAKEDKPIIVDFSAAPECKGCEVCQNDACVDSPPSGFQTCDDECCQGPCAPEGGCCSAFRWCQNATVCCPLGQSCISPLDRAPFCCSALQACQDGGFGEKKVCCDEGTTCKCSLAGCSCQP